MDWDTVDFACNAELTDNGFDFAEKSDMRTKASYCYNAMIGACKDSSCTVGIAQASVTGYKDVSVNSVKTLMSTLAQQAASIIAARDENARDLKTFVE